MGEVVEKGDIYFFYRTKVNKKKATSKKDIQRLYMILTPDGESKSRLFLVGKKRLPEIVKGKSKSTEREWLMIYERAKHDKIGKELGPIEYETKTKGTQHESEAVPVGEGRYKIVQKEDTSRLAYKLARPEKVGEAQKELGIQQEATYILSVRNPDVKVKGFPEEKPDYPKTLAKKFADERWIAVDDPRLLNYEKAQMVLIGAHASLEEADIKVPGKPKLFKNLGLNKKEFPLESLENGNFAKAVDKKEPKSPRGDRTKGGKAGGKKASKTNSAAGVAKALKGVDFPKKKPGLVRYANERDVNEDVIELIKELPNRQYETMQDVQKAVGEVR